jgi:hypothetical protein
MHLVGIGSYGASLVASLWLDAGRRQQLECQGPVTWIASETSAANLLTNRLLQKALTSGAEMTADIGQGPFHPPAGTHIVVGLGGTGAIRLVEAAGKGRLEGCTIHALLPFAFDVYRERAVQAAAALKLWELAKSDRHLLLVDAAEYTHTHESAAVVIKRIQSHLQDSVCKQLSGMTGQQLA